MATLIDLTGQRFNKLLVLERDMSRTGGAAYWICQCDCGNIKSIRGQELRAGKIDCGCGLKERVTPKIDTTSQVGKVYGRLTVLERDLSKPCGHGHGSYWICQCECGTIKSIAFTELSRGGTKSCGCLRSELVTQKNTKDLTDQRFGMVVAKENTWKLSNHNSYIWRCECDCGNTEYYASAENLLSGRIHSCGCNKKSFGEQKIKELLQQAQLYFIPEYTFSDLRGQNNSYLRYDFAILDEKNNPILLIEFDGEQHYKPSDKFGGEQEFLIRQKYDEQKNIYAKTHNIPLKRIPFWEVNDLSIDLLLGDKYLI